jgi:hypothetical protein
MPHALAALDHLPCAPASLPGPIIDLLQALGIDALVFDLNGGGDSGESSLEELRYTDGRTATQIPDLPIGITSLGAVQTLGAYLADVAADAPDGDWVNNEGGYGTVTILPFAAGEDRLTADMTYRTYDDDDEDDEEDWDETLDAFDVVEPSGAGACVTIIGDMQS